MDEVREVLSHARNEKRVAALAKKLGVHRRALAKVTSDSVKMRRELGAMAKRLKKLETASAPSWLRHYAPPASWTRALVKCSRRTGFLGRCSRLAFGV